MPITTVAIPNIGSPPDDPTCPLPATLYVPDTNLFPPPRPCLVGWQAAGFQSGGSKPATMLTDFAGVGFMGLMPKTRLMNNPITGQTTDGKYHQQTDDCKIAIRFMHAANPGGLGYLSNGFVGCFGGSGSAHHALYMALDGNEGDDKTDAAFCMSTPTDFGNRDNDVTQSVINIVTAYGRTTDTTVLTARSPIALDPQGAHPILHFNGDSESMAQSMLTRMISRMQGVANYTSVLNTGATGNLHSFDMWDDIKVQTLAWMILQEEIWSEVDPEPQTTYSPAMWNIVIVDGGGRSRTFKYKKTGSGAFSLTDAIYQALKTTGLVGVTSVTATII